MPWKPGQSGNPNGRIGDKPWREALRRALARAAGKNGGVAEGLDSIAAAVVTLAQQGDMNAIKEIADRLDGKAAQSVDVNMTHERPIAELTDAELTRIAAERGSSAGVAEAQAGPTKPH